MQTNLQSHIPGQSRAAKNRIATYALETWSEAQQEMSTLYTHTSKKEMGKSRTRLFSTIEKIDFASKNGGVVKTPDGTTTTSRRELRTEEYHVGRNADRSDIIDASFDILEAAKEEIKKGEGRLMDRVILGAIVGPARETTAPTIGDDQIIHPTLAASDVYKPVAWCTLARGAANTALTAFTTADLDKIRNIFAQRDVQDEICVTLTPALELLLRQDAQFVNAENRFNASMGNPYGAGLMASQRNFEYKGFRFVYTFNDSMPILSRANLGAGATAPANSSAATVIACRGLDKLTGDVAASRSQTVRAVTNDIALINTTSLDVIHFWSPRAVYFGDNAELMFAREVELQNASFARQIYVRTCLGALVIDDKYVLSAVISGSINTQRGRA